MTARMTKPVAIVQARMGSSRLPGKVLRPILGRPMLAYIVERLRLVPGLAEVVIATSDRDGDEPIRAFCRDNAVACFAGSEQDVLDRFYRAALMATGDPLIRITADCPLADPALIGRVLQTFADGDYDHLAVATGAGALFLDGGRYPDGLDAECLSFAALERAWREATSPLDREHVTPYIWRNKELFRCGHVLSPVDHSTLRWTVDNEEDFVLVSKIYEALHVTGRPFGMDDVLRFLASHPGLSASNRGFIGQEGYGEVWQSPGQQ